MSAPSSQQIDFDEAGSRPYVRIYIQAPSFSVGDRVYLLENGTRKGPYLVATPPSAGKCQLSLENGAAVQGGTEFAVTSLEEA
ncbi:hypothetical protein AK830_g987 [Neonectria ditissima]|uniref:Uncharacterized protein n=1 Tax=Neonectria ditissima TaxID=78410 RepID=A0A0N8H8V2_9HYPO|nr:hypothetical protein AK830_g987 [Neonectria ditissima]